MLPAEFLTIAEAATLIKKRDLSALELVESRLQLIADIDPRLNSFTHVSKDLAREAARIADQEIAAGNYKGSLHGIPLGLKDVYATRGIATTAHSKIMQHNIPSVDAHTVKKLKQAGGIILGKLATHEFAFGGPSFDLPWPPARNPWNTDHFTGGSSSGTGAAVAAGLVLGGTASDTGGSIRGPAAFCGVAGLKPTYGLVGRSGVMLLAPTLDHAGPMAWTAEDCAIMLQAMAGFDGQDSGSVNQNIPDYRAALTQDVKGLRVGLLRHFYTVDNPANAETRDAIDNAAKQLEAMGCIVNEIQLSPLAEWAACGVIIMMFEGYIIHQANLRTRFMDFGEIFRDRLALASLISREDYAKALERRQELIQELDIAMTDIDIILTATAASAAPNIHEVSKFSILEKPLLTIPFNVTGNPAISICCGYSHTGLPLAMQIIGRRFEDATVLRVADAYEKSTAWRQPRPVL